METKISVEAGFRDSLKDLLVIVPKLIPFCGNINDLVSMVQLALENDGQLRLLMSLVVRKDR